MGTHLLGHLRLVVGAVHPKREQMAALLVAQGGMGQHLQSAALLLLMPGVAVEAEKLEMVELEAQEVGAQGEIKVKEVQMGLQIPGAVEVQRETTQ